MPKRAEGGFIGVTPTWSSSARSGVWSMERQLELVRASSWPILLPGYRYWRINSITISGGTYFEVSEIQLYVGGTQQTGATLTSSDTPFGPNGNSSDLAYLVDGDLHTGAYWTTATATGGSFWLKFDFGAGNEKAIDGVKIGGFDTANRFPTGFTLQYSSDNSSWTTLGSKSGLSYPGNYTLSTLYSLP